MSKKKVLLYNTLLLVALWAGLIVVLTLTENMDMIVRMLIGGVLCGLYGVGRKILNEKINDKSQ